MNEAMFVGGEGWVVKPEVERGEEVIGGRTRVGIEVIALSGRQSFFLFCSLALN